MTKEKFLVETLKETMSWPLTHEEKKNKQKEEEETKKRRCKRCFAEFTRKENKEEKKCMQHPGMIISRKEPKFMPVGMSITQIRSMERIEKDRSSNNSNNKELYIFACCSKGLNEQGEKAYAHIEEGEED